VDRQFIVTSRACRDPARLCAGTIKGGRRCLAPRAKLSPNGLCWFHEPLYLQRRRCAQGSGGRARWAGRRALRDLLSIDFGAPNSMTQFRGLILRCLALGAIEPARSKVMMMLGEHVAEDAYRRRARPLGDVIAAWARRVSGEEEQTIGTPEFELEDTGGAEGTLVNPQGDGALSQSGNDGTG
jgi:hypothetical protein